MWPGAIRELRIARGILPLCYADIGANTCSDVFMTDASLDGYAVVQGHFDMDLVWGVCRHQERWRFKRAAQLHVPVMVRSSALAGLDPLDDIFTVRSSLDGEVSPDVICDESFPEVPHKLLRLCLEGSLSTKRGHTLVGMSGHCCTCSKALP